MENKLTEELCEAAKDGRKKIFHIDLVTLLLDRGADVNGKDSDGWTTLHYAARYAHVVDVVTLLLDRGADVNAKDKYRDFTALHHAAESGHVDVAALLIDRGADMNGKDVYGWTPLHYAVENEHADVADLLIDRGADVKIKGGWTALELAEKRAMKSTILKISEKLTKKEGGKK